MTEDLYFIPGTMSDQRLWYPVWERLPGRVRPIYVPIPEGENLADIAVGIVSSLPDQAVSLVGFSLGGYLATLLACDNPWRVARLMVIANSPTALPIEEVRRREAAMSLVTRGRYGGLTATRARYALHSANHGRDDVIGVMQDMDRDGGVAKFSNQFNATTHRDDLTERVAGLNLPIRFLYGDEDTLVDRVVIGRLVEAGGAISAREIAGSGHTMPLERPEVIAEEIPRWLTRQAP